MKIDQASVGMESARSFSAASYSFRCFREKEFSDAFSGRLFGGEEKSSTKDELKEGLSEKEEKRSDKIMTKEGIFELQKKMEGVRTGQVSRSREKSQAESIRYNSILYILELLFKDAKERFRDMMDKNAESVSLSSDENVAIDSATLLTMDASELMRTPVKQLSYSAVNSYVEEEDTSFCAKGVVKCGDGREISFNIDVSMSRRFVRETAVDLGVDFIQTCDPLVINMVGGASSVSDQKIRFDIDGDGELDTVNELAFGSGYLALDKNGDGIIGDGNELFGAKSGDGFADLAEYDEDGNGWIDENDGIWQKLKIWAADENGKFQLYSLTDKGVGALCLNKMSTQFADTDDNNHSKAFIRSTGVFLYENGMAGTLQHLDLVKYAGEA